MSAAEPGDTVRIEYEGRKSENEQIIGSSEEEGGPLEFTLGQGEVIPGLEEAVAGMEPGEQKEVEVPPPLAYGERDEERQAKVPRSALPPNYDPEPGDILEVERDDGARYPVTVEGTEGKELVVDENHPLAGETLEFELELVDILEGATEDLEAPGGPAEEDLDAPGEAPEDETGKPPDGNEPEPGPERPDPDGPGELDDGPT
jgi:peptidylprolyl isomerase